MGTSGRLVAPLFFAVLVAATIAVLVLSQNIRSSLLVDRVEISKRVNPEAEKRARVSFRLTENESAGTVEVIDGEDEVVATLADEEALGDFEIHRFYWDGGGAPPGVYRVRLSLDSHDREIDFDREIELVDGRDG